MRKNKNIRKIANVSLALLISISHGASAMERNNYETILREIENLTARIHREVDQVLTDYKRDTEEYHRRMGVKRGTMTTMASLPLTTKISEESGRGRVRQERKETQQGAKQSEKNSLLTTFLRSIGGESNLINQPVEVRAAVELSRSGTRSSTQNIPIPSSASGIRVVRATIESLKKDNDPVMKKVLTLPDSKDTLKAAKSFNEINEILAKIEQSGSAAAGGMHQPGNGRAVGEEGYLAKKTNLSRGGRLESGGNDKEEYKVLLENASNEDKFYEAAEKLDVSQLQQAYQSLYKKVHPEEENVPEIKRSTQLALKIRELAQRVVAGQGGAQKNADLDTKSAEELQKSYDELLQKLKESMAASNEKIQEEISNKLEKLESAMRSKGVKLPEEIEREAEEKRKAEERKQALIEEENKNKESSKKVINSLKTSPAPEGTLGHYLSENDDALFDNFTGNKSSLVIKGLIEDKNVTTTEEMLRTYIYKVNSFLADPDLSFLSPPKLAARFSPKQTITETDNLKGLFYALRIRMDDFGLAPKASTSIEFKATPEDLGSYDAFQYYWDKAKGSKIYKILESKAITDFALKLITLPENDLKEMEIREKKQLDTIFPPGMTLLELKALRGAIAKVKKILVTGAVLNETIGRINDQIRKLAMTDGERKASGIPNLSSAVVNRTIEEQRIISSRGPVVNFAAWVGTVIFAPDSVGNSVQTKLNTISGLSPDMINELAYVAQEISDKERDMTKLNRAKLLHKTLTDRGVPEGPGRMPIITAIQGVMDSVLGVQVKIEALPNLVIGNDDWLKDPIQKELVAQIRRLDSTKIKSASQIIKKLAAGNIDIRNMDDPTATDAINKASLQVEADKAPKQVIQDRITELFPTVKKINLPSLATRLFDGGYNLVGSNEDDKLLIKRAALSLKMNDAALK